jgi:hypothetical protein
MATIWTRARALALFIFLITVARADARQTTTSLDNAPSPLRIADRSLLGIVSQGMARSPTLREIVAHLQWSHAIVYVSLAAVPTGTVGLTRFMGASDGWRYLSVELDHKLPHNDLVATLGHELQHVTEIIDARAVSDGPSMLALYRRIGNERSFFQNPVPSFETDAAVAVGRRVYWEVFSQGR